MDASNNRDTKKNNRDASNSRDTKKNNRTPTMPETQ